MGRTVRAAGIAQGSTSTSLETGGLAAGVYMVRAVSGHHITVKPLVVLR